MNTSEVSETRIVLLPIVFLLCWLFSLSIPFVLPMKIGQRL
jgi:hypothetical protein